MAIGYKRRFGILARDSFRCQYCGASPGDAELRVDHIKPRCEGGGDEDDNLITACHPCNAGKGRYNLVPFCGVIGVSLAYVRRWQGREVALRPWLRTVAVLADIIHARFEPPFQPYFPADNPFDRELGEVTDLMVEYVSYHIDLDLSFYCLTDLIAKAESLEVLHGSLSEMTAKSRAHYQGNSRR